jgi:hypothetical protein
MKDKKGILIITAWALYLLLQLAVAVAIAVVAIHFISKVW